MKGRTLLRILQDDYNWEGEIPLVRDMAFMESFWVRYERNKDKPYPQVHEGWATGPIVTRRD
jgi:hypothetical protein